MGIGLQNAYTGQEPPNYRQSSSRSTAGQQGNGLAVTSLSSLNSRKRKMDDDDGSDGRSSMSTSPAPPNLQRPRRHQDTESAGQHHQQISQHNRHSPKRSRTEVVASVRTSLSLTRLLETLDGSSLRNVISRICVDHPEIAEEIEATAPRPSVESALVVLKGYETRMQNSFPYGGDASSEYSYNRVRPHLLLLLSCLNDFIPHFLPPHEPQTSQSLSFLDNVTDLVHRLPCWHAYQHTLHKTNAYEELSKAWAFVIQEVSKRAGGMQLQYEGWHDRIIRHDDLSGGKLVEARQALSKAVEWIDPQSASNTAAAPHTSSPHTQSQRTSDELAKLRQELFSGTYAANVPVKVGPW